MRDQLKRLEELQKHDARIQEITNALQAIPAKLKATENDLARVEALLNNERAQLADTQRYYQEQKTLLESDGQHVSGAKHKLAQAKNPKEFSAAQREIEQTRESLTSREAEIAKLVDAIAAKEKLLAERSSEVQALRDSIAKDSESARAKMGELEGQLAGLKGERDKLASGVRADVLKRYGSIRIRRGLAIAPVRNGACTACNMNIPPQLYIVLQRATTIESCPYCHRIIYWEELMKEEAPAEAKADGAAPATATAE